MTLTTTRHHHCCRQTHLAPSSWVILSHKVAPLYIFFGVSVSFSSVDVSGVASWCHLLVPVAWWQQCHLHCLWQPLVWRLLLHWRHSLHLKHCKYKDIVINSFLLLHLTHTAYLATCILLKCDTNSTCEKYEQLYKLPLCFVNTSPTGGRETSKCRTRRAPGRIYTYSDSKLAV